jgi:hypothetical protein
LGNLKEVGRHGGWLSPKSLEELIRGIDLELTKTEAKLAKIAEKFGLNSWREFEELFKGRIDNSEINLAWAEYCYLKDRYKSLLRDREKALQLLSRS